MNRPALRFLAVGFLVSALVLSGYRLFLYEPSTSTAKSSETAKKEKLCLQMKSLIKKNMKSF